jgi:prevent-host-death family protein
MRTPATRWQHSRAGLRHASDLTDEAWRILQPLPPGAPRRGRRRAWPLRELVNAIFCMLRAGCTWRLLPDSFPPPRTVCRWFVRLRDGGVFEAINHHLVMLDRERAGREASPMQKSPVAVVVARRLALSRNTRTPAVAASMTAFCAAATAATPNSAPTRTPWPDVTPPAPGTVTARLEPGWMKLRMAGSLGRKAGEAGMRPSLRRADQRVYTGREHREGAMTDETTVSVREFRARLSDHLRRVQRGQSVLVTSNGEPVARLVPVERPAAAPRPFGFMKGRIRIAPDFRETPPDLLAALEASPFPPRRRGRAA